MKAWRLVFLGLPLLAALMPEAAMAQSETACLSAIRLANQHRRADSVPDPCWRLGPLTLGMKQGPARVLLGRPDASARRVVVYHRRRFPLTQMLYVYPRNLKSWLRLAPQRDLTADTLRLTFWRGQLVAITAGQDIRPQDAPCAPRRAAHVFAFRRERLTFAFHGVALGGSMPQAEARLGRFASRGRGRQTYWPVPIALDGESAITSIDIASGMAFAARSPTPVLTLRRDPATCLVTGYGVPGG